MTSRESSKGLTFDFGPNVQRRWIKLLLTGFISWWIFWIGQGPTLMQILFIGTISIGQFVAIFMFMARFNTYDLIEPRDIDVTFDDIYGQDKAVARLKELAHFLKSPDLIESLGGEVPKGTLLWGPPGTGKTMMAKALAKELGIPSIICPPGCFQAMFIGVNILKVKRTFKKARQMSAQYGGCVLFFDEMDALGSRGAVDPKGFRAIGKVVNRIVGMGMGSGQDMGTMAVLLSEMDGIVKPRGWRNILRKLGFIVPIPKPRIIILGATNLPERLDAALLRDGRMDRKIRVPYPDLAGRKRTFEGYLAKVPNEITEDQVQTLASNNPYASGAAIKGAVNEALIATVMNGRQVITWTDIRDAIITKELGESDGRQENDEDQRRVAIHEAAHAVAAHVFRPNHRIQFASVERRSNTLGVVSSVPTEERFTKTIGEYEADVMVAMASHWAEKKWFGDVSTGPSHDIQAANMIVSTIIRSGLREGDGFYVPSPSPMDGQVYANPKAVKEYLKQLYERMVETMDKNERQVAAIADLLDENTTVDGEVIHRILGEWKYDYS